MKIIKWLPVLGALLTASWGVFWIVLAFSEVPGRPGPFELAVQGFLILVLAVPGALLGFLLRWFLTRKREPR